MRFATLTLFAASLASAQPSAPGGLVYQALLKSGVSYISPSAGQAILNQKAGLNWKTLLAEGMVDGSLYALTGGVSGIVKMSSQTETALGGFHLFADKKIAPILLTAGSHPDSIPPVLQVNQAMSPTSTGCAENSIYAVFNYKAPPKIAPVTINGVTVSFSPQGVQVLKNASGAVIKSFQIIDVLACLPEAFIALPAAPPTTTRLQPLSDAPGMIPRMWTVATERPEETGLAAMRGGWGRGDVTLQAAR